MKTRVLTTFILPLFVGFAAPVFAQDAGECASDADCADGTVCEKGMYSNGCGPDAEPCDDTVYEEEFGRCVVPPTECDTDDDCGEYSACESSDVGVCWADSNGDSGCEEPDPDAPSYCVPAFVECQVESDCPREFECVQNDVCLAIDCVEGEACSPCEPTGGQCLPKQIECDADSACPSDWTCVARVEYECSGGGTEPIDGGGSTDEGGADEPVADPAEGERLAPAEEDCVEVVTTSYCQPDDWEGSYYGSDGGFSRADSGEGDDLAGSNGDSEEAASGDSGETSGGGCSVSAGGIGGRGFSWLLLLGAPLLLARRRRSIDALIKQ